jgi:hypothetical protein
MTSKDPTFPKNPCPVSHMSNEIFKNSPSARQFGFHSCYSMTCNCTRGRSVRSIKTNATEEQEKKTLLDCEWKDMVPDKVEDVRMSGKQPPATLSEVKTVLRSITCHDEEAGPLACEGITVRVPEEDNDVT